MSGSARALRSTPARLSSLLVVTEGGHAKRLELASVPVTGRGRSGVRVSREPVAAALVVSERDDVLIATRAGRLERVAVADVPVMDRRARGVRIIDLASGDIVTTAAVAAAVDVDTPRRLRPAVVCGPARRALGRSGVQASAAAQRTEGR